jgi:hypothetical protein
MTWIGTIPGFSPDMVATQLPTDTSTWARTGFVTVSVVGGTPAADLPVKKPVMQIDGWAVKPGSNKPRWAPANLLLEVIRYAALQRTGFNRLLNPVAGNVSYPACVVDSVVFLTEPRRGYGDPGDYARYTVDAQFTWRTVPDVIP